MKMHEIKEQRATAIAELTRINEGRGEGDLDGETRARWDQLSAKVDGLNTRLADAERLAEFERMAAGGERVAGSGEIRSLARYSLAKAVSESSGGRLTGLEAEWHQELSRGREVRGVMVPTDILLGGERRALTSTTPAGQPGANMIGTDLAAMTDRRRAALKVEGLGATVLSGLTGNLDMPRLAGSGAANWVAEHGAATRSAPGFSKTSMAPKTVTAEYEVSRRMLIQSHQALEPILRADLAYLLAAKLDRAAILGGGDNEPTGILANASVRSVTAIATAGETSGEGVLMGDTAAELMAALEMDDVTGTRAFLTHPGLTSFARKLRATDGRNIPVADTFHQERVETSTQVPANRGASSDATPLIYGEWASLYVGYWSGVDLLLNPYHADVASKGGALLHAFLDTDVVVRHPEGFAWSDIRAEAA